MATLQGARAPSTNVAYDLRWRIFSSWCTAHDLDPESCNVQAILLFLQSCLDKGLSASTVKVYLAAISAGHVQLLEGSVGRHPLVSMFMKGARRQRPARVRKAVRWDLDIVLSALARPPFEPLESASLKHLSMKVAFLLAITSTKRVGELHALSVSPECFQVGPDRKSVVLRPNPSFLPKVLPEGYVNSSWSLSAFSPSADGEEHVLCPVRALQAYVSRTQSLRRTDQLFVCYAERVMGSSVSKQRLSHWIVDTIHLAYSLAGRPQPVGVVAHSTRGTATSRALLRGVPLSEVCAAASWASSATFARFYNINVATPSAVVSAVLGSSS